jgi:hypothetical protein
MPKLSLSVLTFVLLLSSCSDIIEEDLDGFGVVLLTPPADHTSLVNQVEFRWEEVPNATSYRIQVSSPNFNSAVLFVLDSNTTATTHVLTLSPGEYQWRVRAENANSHTDWYTRSLTVTSSETLTGQVPVLISPVNGFISDTGMLTFEWDTLPFTVDHRFELRADDQNGAVLQAMITPESELTLTSLADGHFAWGVQAQNDVPSTSGFAYRLFTVDATSPTAPVQLLPAAGATVPEAPFTFLWQSGQDVLTDTEDSLFVRNSLLQLVREVGGVSGTFADSLGAGTYTWTVKTMDEAGNTTSAGPITFTVQ